MAFLRNTGSFPAGGPTQGSYTVELNNRIYIVADAALWEWDKVSPYYIKVADAVPGETLAADIAATTDGSIICGTDGGRCLKWNGLSPSVSEGGSGAWIVIASGSDARLFSVAEYNSKFYCGGAFIGSDKGKLLETPNASGSSFTEVADYYLGQNNIHHLFSASDGLLATTAFSALLFEWDQSISAWENKVSATPQYLDQNELFFGLEYAGSKWAGTSPDGYLFQWDGVDSWISWGQASADGYTPGRLISLVGYGNYIYAVDNTGDAVLRWNLSTSAAEYISSANGPTSILIDGQGIPIVQSEGGTFEVLDSLSADFYADTHLQFVGNSIDFIAELSGNGNDIISYEWDWGEAGIKTVETSGVQSYAYKYSGLKHPSMSIYYGSSAVDSYGYPYTIRINPSPAVKFEDQDPYEGETLTFEDSSGPYYFPDTIDSVWWDFGDGSPQESASDPTTQFIHSYSAAGVYNVGLSAFDISGNVDTDTFSLGILSAPICITKSDYITLCGPEEARYGSCKLINLTNFLPEYQQNTEEFELVEFFEDFLNEMFSGLCGFATEEDQISQDVSKLVFTYPDQNLSASPKISILEKVKRISELHDPDLIDINYIQFFAAHLGYNMNITRDEVGFGLFETGGVCSASDNEDYLRFMVRNLPNWYKIKSTNDMMKIMLYSFGLVADIYTYYTNNYSNWKMDYIGDLSEIPDSWYPTPHFNIVVDVDESFGNIFFRLQEGEKIIRAILTNKPLNTVFRGLTAKASQLIELYCYCNSRSTRYIRIPNDGYADYWYSP